MCIRDRGSVDGSAYVIPATQTATWNFRQVGIDRGIVQFDALIPSDVAQGVAVEIRPEHNFGVGLVYAAGWKVEMGLAEEINYAFSPAPSTWYTCLLYTSPSP